jgi:DNA-binding LytR/AlgR family response regulator
MTAPRILIAEDEPLLAASLATQLAACWPERAIVAQVGDGASALAQALARRPDVCFLDIRMPALDGIAAARAMAEDWPADAAFPLIVFVTAHDDHAVQAFEAGAVDYLLKPVEAPRLAACIARLRQRLAARSIGPGLAEAVARLAVLAPAPAPPAPPLELIRAQAGAAVHFVPVEEVVYFDAADKYLRVMTAEREHLVRLSLRELLPQLDPRRFWQIHRGTVVQVRCIESARRDDTGRVLLTLRRRPETLVASRLYAHLFRSM